MSLQTLGPPFKMFHYVSNPLHSITAVSVPKDMRLSTEAGAAYQWLPYHQGKEIPGSVWGKKLYRVKSHGPKKTSTTRVLCQLRVPASLAFFSVFNLEYMRISETIIRLLGVVGAC